MPAAEVAGNSDICQILPSAEATEDFSAVRVCPATRSAQRGPLATLQLYRALLTTSRMLPANTHLLQENDTVVIVDVHVHAGDHALASVMLAAEMPSLNLKHVMVQMKTKQSSNAVAWTTSRVLDFVMSPASQP